LQNTCSTINDYTHLMKKLADTAAIHKVVSWQSCSHTYHIHFRTILTHQLHLSKHLCCDNIFFLEREIEPYMKGMMNTP